MISIGLIQGDITRLEVDAIVNAANSSLMGGGGVDGAIHRAGGPAILEACRQIVKSGGQCKPGEAVITPAGNLKANYVIHTVGPIWRGGFHQEESILANAYHNSLRVAHENAIQTIAFPNISTGVYNFPKPRAAEIAIHAVKIFGSSSVNIREVIFCCFDEENYQLYSKLLK